MIFDGFDELDAIGPLEVFRMAENLGADLSAELITLLPQPTVTASHGLIVSPDASYRAHTYEAIVVAGGGWVARSDDGVWGEVQRGDWLPVLAAEAAAGTLMLSVCTGAMLLAAAGVIGQRRAATHHSAWDDLRATGAIVVPERIIDEGDLITSGGVTSGIDLALHLVDRVAGASLAKSISRQLEY